MVLKKFKILVLFSHTYHFASEDMDSLNGVVWIIVLFVLHGFLSANFGSSVYFQYGHTEMDYFSRSLCLCSSEERKAYTSRAV